MVQSSVAVDHGGGHQLGQQPAHMGKPSMLKMIVTMLTNKAVGE